ncbi:MAG TPA: inositol monophosphatase family protein [Actinomycetota bacterium]|nr:inositol monophosphatase family protein [Actinomycetota bacterium]
MPDAGRDLDLERLRAVARAAALRGGEIVSAGRTSDAGATSKSLPGDWVTEVDVASEGAIASMLAEETPDVPIQGEEAGGVATGLRWVVDPLDGTTNFIHGFVAVGVSVALVDDRRVLIGATHAPFLGEMWHAAADAGAVWERADGSAVACRVSQRPWSEAVVGTGFPFRRKERLDRYLGAMRRVFEGAEDLRRPGAACLDLAWVASGVFDGFFELGLAPWDVAVGALLIAEAGGVVSDWSGGDDWLDGDIVTGAPQVWERLVAATSAPV